MVGNHHLEPTPREKEIENLKKEIWNDGARGTYNTGSQIKFKNLLLK